MKTLIENVKDYIHDLEPYPPGKPLEELKREYGIEEAIKLASNENPFGPSPKAIEAIRDALGAIHRYPDGSGYYLKEKLKELWGVESQNIVLGNGSNEIIQFLIHAFSGPGTEVISSDPAFLVYRKMVQVFGGKNILVRLRENSHDLNAILSKVNEKTRLIFLDNPHNPTGSVIRTDEFNAFLAALPDHVLVCLDEAYGEFVREPDVPFGIDYFRKDPRVVFLRTFSKAYGLSGLRIGYGIMAKEIASILERVRQPFNVNALAQIAALHALEDRGHLEHTLQATWEGLDWYFETLQDLGFKPLKSNTNFMLVDLGMDAKTIYEKMLRRGVIIRAMNAYGFPTSIRITVGTPAENKRCIEALKEVTGRR